MSKEKPSRYVLITPIKDEEKYVTGLIESVTLQTVLPRKWIIVSDCSTDKTDEIISSFAPKHPFIEHLCIEGSTKRSFGAKALVFMRGLERLSGIDYEFIGNLDADVTFAPNFYEEQLKRMNQHPELGLCSGACLDKTPDGFKQVTITENHAVGAVQFFRRSCFEATGGYQAVSVGGMDSIAVHTARMKGWKTKCFFDLPFYHHKPVDSASSNSALRIARRAGETEYHIGTHPLFAIVKALRRWRSSPPVFSAVTRMSAYFCLWVTRSSRDASAELTYYVHHEQLSRLKRLFSRR